jgi:hypothetical protein
MRTGKASGTQGTMVVVASVFCLETTAAAEPDPAVQWGHDALARWQRYPWYDPLTDTAAPVEIRETEHLPPAPGALDGLLQGLAWTLIAAVLAGFVLLLVRYWLRMRRQSKSSPAAQPRVAPVPEMDLLPAAVDRGKGSLLDEARKAYEGGDFGRAIVFLFSYQLLRLDQQQIIRLARGKTNRQYLREAAPRRPLADIVWPTMIAFEEVFFGKHPLNRAQFEACWSQLPRFEQLCLEAPS